MSSARTLEAIVNTCRQPAFGEWFTGIYASDDNPRKHGMYVRTIRRTTNMNPGFFYELTDGRGDFWESPPANVEGPAQMPTGAEIDAAARVMFGSADPTKYPNEFRDEKRRALAALIAAREAPTYVEL